MDADSKLVLVTGATGHLGPAVVEAFLQTGAVVAAVGRQTPPPRERVIPMAADLTVPEDAARVAAQAAAAGPIDVLVHALGGFASGGAVDETSDAIWRGMMDLNLNAAFYVLRAVLPHMKARGRGRIIAVGSRSGAAPAGGLAAYSVSKAGLHALIECVAAEVEGTGITANAVLPSFIDAAKGVSPDSIARLIVWLAGPEAADVNGALIPIYGRA